MYTIMGSIHTCCVSELRQPTLVAIAMELTHLLVLTIRGTSKALETIKSNFLPAPNVELQFGPAGRNWLVI